MPLSNITTPANGSERQQVMPLIDRILVKTNSPGRPRKRVKVLAAGVGYDAKDLRKALRKVLWGTGQPHKKDEVGWGKVKQVGTLQ